jgi:hypothetical protein
VVTREVGYDTAACAGDHCGSLDGDGHARIVWAFQRRCPEPWTEARYVAMGLPQFEAEGRARLSVEKVHISGGAEHRRPFPATWTMRGK